MADKVTREIVELTAVDKFSAVIGQAQAQFKGLGSSIDTIKNALAAVGVTVGAGAMAQLYLDVVKATAALDDMAEQTGASVEELSKIQAVAKIGGHEFGGVTEAIGKMVKGLKGADEEGQAASHALEFLGVKAKDTNGRFRDGAVILQEVARELAKYEDGGNKVALVQDLLGKSGARYLSLLKDMADEGEIQAKVTAQQAAEAERFEKNLNRIKIVMEDNKREFVTGITPAVVDFLERLLAAQKAAGGLASGLALVATTDLSNVGEQLRDLDKLIEAADPSKWHNRVANFFTMGFSGFVTGMNESQMRNQREYLRFVQRQQALAGTGPQDYDARDIRLRTPQSMYYESPDKNKGPKGPSLEDLLAEGSGVSKDFGRDLQILHRGYETGRITLEQYREAVEKLIEKQSFAKEIAKQEAEATKNLVAWLEAEEKQRDELAAKIAGFVVSNSERLQQIQFETRLIGLENGEREKLIEFRRIDLEAQKASIGQSAEEIRKIDERAAAMKAALGVAIDEKVAREKAHDAAQKAAQEWKESFQRVAQSIEQALTQGIVDALMNGFRKGESFGKNFLRVLQDAFRTAVLTPVIQAVVRPAAQAMTGLIGGTLGFAGNAFAGGGGGGGGFNPLSLLSSGMDLGGAWNSIANPILSGLGLGGGGISVGAAAGFDIALGGLGGTAGGEALLAGGLGAGSGIAAAMPYVGLALMAGSALGLFGDDSDEPPPGYRRDNWIRLHRNDGVNFGLESSEVPDPQVMGNLASQLFAALNDAKQYDPAVLERFVGRTFSGGPGTGSQDLVNQLLAAIAPSAESAQGTIAAEAAQKAAQTASFTGRLNLHGGLVAAIQGFRTSQQVSPYLSPLDQLSGARSIFSDLRSRALAGDPAAVASLQGGASQLLEAGRRVYASGPDFQALVQEVNQDLADTLARAQEEQLKVLRETPATITQGFQDQIAELRKQTDRLVEELRLIARGLRLGGQGA